MGSSLIGDPLRGEVRPRTRADALGGAGFVSGGEFSEDELLLVNTDDQLLTEGRDALVGVLDASTRPVGRASRELYGAEIELVTAVCRSGDDVRSSLAALRRALRSAGGRAMAVGVHPAGEFGQVGLTRSSRYDTIGSTLAGLLRTPTAALQVHVGVPDPPSAIAALRGLRHHLALLRALACGSPYWHGRDSGLASARWAVISSYPRSGVPPAVRSWEEYVVLTEAVMTAAEVPDYTHVWWDVRIQPRFGTVEVRGMDAQPSLDTIAGLTTLTQGLARSAVERPPGADVPTEVLAENDFRVSRHGLDATITDAEGRMRPVRELAQRALTEARKVLSADDLDGPLDAVERVLQEEPAYVRQRRIHDDRGMAGLLRHLTERTDATV